MDVSSCIFGPESASNPSNRYLHSEVLSLAVFRKMYQGQTAVFSVSLFSQSEGRAEEKNIGKISHPKRTLGNGMRYGQILSLLINHITSRKIPPNHDVLYPWCQSLSLGHGKKGRETPTNRPICLKIGGFMGKSCFLWELQGYHGWIIQAFGRKIIGL